MIVDVSESSSHKNIKESPKKRQMPSTDDLKRYQSPDSANVSSDDEIQQDRNNAQLPRVERPYTTAKPECSMYESPEQPNQQHSSAEFLSDAEDDAKRLPEAMEDLSLTCK